MITSKLHEVIRDVNDFPKPGIVFKDITPVLSNPDLCQDILAEFESKFKDQGFDAVVGIESRGFLFGMPLAQRLGIPFVPIRKSGKLPYDKISYSYELEYGEATVEIHSDAIQSGWKVLIHDDLLATGGTACAAAELVEKLGGEVAGFAFIITLKFLEGAKRLEKYCDHTFELITY